MLGNFFNYMAWVMLMHTNKRMELPKNLVKLMARAFKSKSGRLNGAPQAVEDLFKACISGDRGKIVMSFKNFSNMMQGILH